MQPTRSLSAFFSRTDPSTLNTCERERIHLSGAIQPVGALLVVDPDSGAIVGASENTAALFGIDADRLLRSALTDIDVDLAEQVGEMAGDDEILHETLDFSLEHGGIRFDTVTHLHAGRRLIEFVPNVSPSAGDVRKKMRLCNKANARIMRAEHFPQAMQIAVDAVRQITGYARVKIYRFHADWSGETVAESGSGALPSYLGLHFPEGDIPKQVRDLMSIVPCRAIGTTSNETIGIHRAGPEGSSLDLTWSILRSVSPMHTAYLDNMGAAAAFSCALQHRGVLWGMIACHDDEPGLLPVDTWTLIQEIGSSLMLRHDQQTRTDVADAVRELRTIESRFAAALRSNENVEEVIETLVPVLQEFLGADGFAFQYGANLHVSGATPPPEFIHELIQWSIKRRETSDQFQTNALHREWAPGADHVDTACGVLLQPIATHRVCQLLWFRGPITRTVTWAGRHDAKSSGGQAISPAELQPRASFERWEQEHRDQSAPWGERELVSAREIFKEFLDIIASQVLLKNENASLRLAAASAAHDLAAPLRGIGMALDIMTEEVLEEEELDEQTFKRTHEMATRSIDRLTSLTSSLLELTVMEEQEHEFRAVDLTSVLADVRDMLFASIDSEQAEIRIGTMPRLVANEPLVLRLLLNLIGNALKYRHPDRAPRIDIDASVTPTGEVQIEVADNGMGIDADNAERIFQPMERLHSQEAIEGSGLGLSICQRIVDVHSGSIGLDPDRVQGSRFIITLPQAA